MTLHIHNSRGNELEPFVPSEEGTVRIYNCGPTVYNFNHIGNFRSYIFVDQLRRYFLLKGYHVHHTSNITDVEDKIIENSIKKHQSISEFTAPYIRAFLDDLKTLRIQEVENRPTATGSMDRIIEMIQTLEDRGHTYNADGNIYFRIQSFDQYGNLSGIDPDHLKTAAGGRFDADEYDKENARDFALWKKPSDEQEPSWSSPWGNGRPGWHIECSAMIRDTYHEKGVDIHCGGIDLLFPHHENEIAQSECAYPHDSFVRYWMHNEHLLVDGKKMSKSLGNFYTLRDLTEIQRANALIEKKQAPGFLLDLIKSDKIHRALRYLLSSTHYRVKLNFTFENLKAADAACDRLRNVVSRLKEASHFRASDFETFFEDLTKEDLPGRKGEQFAQKHTMGAQTMKRFFEAMDEDLNIARALAATFDFVRDLNAMIDRGLSEEEARHGAAFLYAADRILDVMDLFTPSDDDSPDQAEILTLIEERNNAKKAKDYQRADAIRDELQSRGIRIKDTPSGTTWEQV